MHNTVQTSSRVSPGSSLAAALLGVLGHPVVHPITWQPSLVLAVEVFAAHIRSAEASKGPAFRAGTTAELSRSDQSIPWRSSFRSTYGIGLRPEPYGPALNRHFRRDISPGVRGAQVAVQDHSDSAFPGRSSSFPSIFGLPVRTCLLTR